jgi:hypothetical protein
MDDRSVERTRCGIIRGRWTHVPSLQTLGPRGWGFVGVTGELVVVWTSQFGLQMVDEEDVLWGWYTVTEV